MGKKAKKVEKLLRIGRKVEKALKFLGLEGREEIWDWKYLGLGKKGKRLENILELRRTGEKVGKEVERGLKSSGIGEENGRN